MSVEESPHTQHTPNVSFKDAPLATPQKEAVAHRKRPQTTWDRRSSLCMKSMFSTKMKNVMTPKVQRVSSNTRTTTVLILIQISIVISQKAMSQKINWKY